MHPHFRFYRYEVGQFFKWHRDGYMGQGESVQSLLTFLIYLNEDYSGGETEFRWGRLPTKTGKALVFPHRLVHQGATVEQGVKYVLRTDVMYSAISEQI
jgi:predicted 2-oxoglutarate/Fe(II)-dependent dioxygenase YbiX